MWCLTSNNLHALRPWIISKNIYKRTEINEDFIFCLSLNRVFSASFSIVWRFSCKHARRSIIQPQEIMLIPSNSDSDLDNHLESIRKVILKNAALRIQFKSLADAEDLITQIHQISLMPSRIRHSLNLIHRRAFLVLQFSKRCGSFE